MNKVFIGTKLSYKSMSDKHRELIDNEKERIQINY